MTNSRLTDPEILETRYPVLLERFAIRARLGRARARIAAATASSAASASASRCTPASSPTAAASRRAGIEGGGDARPGVNKVRARRRPRGDAERHRLGRDGGRATCS